MMTDSQKSFVKVKLWFSKLIVESPSAQKKQTDKLLKDGVLDKKQIKLLRDMLQADQETGMATDIESVSSEIIDEATSQETTLNNKQIGPYKIISSLGEGGMGQVYLAERNDGQFEQSVALKLPHSSFNKQILERFENERQILAQLTHNNIARLLDGGTAENNQPYLVMEHIQGKNIDQYCSEKIPSLHERLQLILQICSAVTFSHQQLILHRDIKPSNILVTDSGQVKLLDFGIAKLLDLDEEAKAKQTATQIMTRYYASPEQLQGKPASTHSDMFSLAIIAYELITGYHPYQHETQHEREQNLISGKVMRVTQRTDNNEALLPELAKIPSEKLQGDLENILLKALSVDPEKRYESVKDFADDLNNYIENKPVSAHKPSKLYSIKKWAQRNKAFAILAIFTLISLITATVYSVNKANFAIKQQMIAEVESEKSAQVSDFLKSLFKKAKPMSASKQLTAQDLLFQGFQDIDEEDFTQPEVKFELLVIIHKSLISMGNFKESGDVIENHIQECQQSLKPNNKTCVKLIRINSSKFHYQKEWALSLEQSEKALALALTRQPHDIEEIADIYTDMNPDLVNLNRKEEAKEHILKVIEMTKNSKTPDYKRLINTTHNLALNYVFEDDFIQAKSLIDKIPAYLEQLKEKDMPLWMGSHYGLNAYFYSSQKMAKKSYEFRQKRVDLIASNYELLPQKFGSYLKSAASMARRAGFLDKSEELFNKAYDFYVDNVTNNVKYRFPIINDKANLYFQLKKKELLKMELAKLDEIYDGIENVDYTEQYTYNIGKLYLQFDQLKATELQTEFEKLVNTTPEKESKRRAFKFNTGLLEARINMKAKNKLKVQEILKGLNETLEQYPNDFFGYKIIVENTEKELNKLPN